MTENKTLNDIKTLIDLWESKKQDKKAVNDFFKLENKIDFIHKLNEKVLNQFLKAKDKSGFIMVFNTDIFKLYLKKYYEKNGVFFVLKNDKMFLLYDDEKDILNCLDFKSYAFKVIDENKQKERERKEKYKRQKLNIKLDDMTSEKLNALIYQAREKLKQLNNKKQ